MTSLYEISAEYQRALDVFDGLNPVMECILDSIDEEFENKAIAVASYIKNISAEKDMVIQAINQMKERVNSLSKKEDNLKCYLLFHMNSCNIKEIASSPYFKIKVKKSPPSVRILDEESIPTEYKKIKEIITVDKIKAKEDISQGIYINGLELQHNNYLEIK